MTLTRSFRIGRGAHNHLAIPEATSLSGLHAEIDVKPNGDIYVIDRSTNGTFVGDQRLAKDEWVAVPINATVRLSTTYLVRFERAAAAPQVAQARGPTPEPPPSVRQLVPDMKGPVVQPAPVPWAGSPSPQAPASQPRLEPPSAPVPEPASRPEKARTVFQPVRRPKR
jgi:hypothetical protein